MPEPLGYLVTMAGAAACATAALVAPVPRRSSPLRLSFLLSMVVAEVPVLGIVWVAGWTALAAAEGDLRTRSGAVGLGLAGVAVVGLVVVAGIGARAPAAVERALVAGLGPGVRTTARPSWVRWVAPLPVRPRAVERLRGVRYGDARRQRLDVYRPRVPSGASVPAGVAAASVPARPVLVHLHGGAFRGGGRSREARALLHRLAAAGWLCVSADYRLAPRASFPDPLVDVKRVLAWVRAHAAELGADPGRVALAGSSAGGHLAALAAFTAGDAALQPGFADADTSVAAVVSLYGYPGPVSGGGRSWSPTADVVPGAPPFLVVHGARDTLVVAADQRRFVARLRAVSLAPVVHLELPGAQHGFDLLRSYRFEAVVDGVEAFLAHVVGGPGGRGWSRVTPAANTQARRQPRG
ncbi:alpha/beta hydrolase [Actinotalea solisilvae]|uniref:alpha/beta hydrolase n=1 Tax=Actinotalea solisilvae TaxID=2072922 RepID=UPI0027DB329A|nr:alpha/beta hydrolase [Actinotalea solisilvae]